MTNMIAPISQFGTSLIKLDPRIHRQLAIAALNEMLRKMQSESTATVEVLSKQVLAQVESVSLDRTSVDLIINSARESARRAESDPMPRLPSTLKSRLDDQRRAFVQESPARVDEILKALRSHAGHSTLAIAAASQRLEEELALRIPRLQDSILAGEEAIDRIEADLRRGSEIVEQTRSAAAPSNSAQPSKWNSPRYRLGISFAIAAVFVIALKAFLQISSIPLIVGLAIPLALFIFFKTGRKHTSQERTRHELPFGHLGDLLTRYGVAITSNEMLRRRMQVIDAVAARLRSENDRSFPKCFFALQRSFTQRHEEFPCDLMTGESSDLAALSGRPLVEALWKVRAATWQNSLFLSALQKLNLGLSLEEFLREQPPETAAELMMQAACAIVPAPTLAEVVRLLLSDAIPSARAQFLGECKAHCDLLGSMLSLRLSLLENRDSACPTNYSVCLPPELRQEITRVTPEFLPRQVPQIYNSRDDELRFVHETFNWRNDERAGQQRAEHSLNMFKDRAQDELWSAAVFLARPGLADHKLIRPFGLAGGEEQASVG